LKVTLDANSRHLAAPSDFALNTSKESGTSSGGGGGARTLSQPCAGDPPVRATVIFPHLLLGSERDVKDSVLMEEERISRVLNVSINCKRPPLLDDDHFRRIAVHDNNLENIEPHLDDAVDFLEEARQKKERVLVHCLAGVSRSATIAIAYVMYYLKLRHNDAYRFVKEKRPTISPNFNFLGQLIEYEKRLTACGRLEKKTQTIPTPSATPHPKTPSFQVHCPSFRVSSSISVTSAPSRRRKGLKFDLRPAKTTTVARQQGYHGCGVVLDLHKTPQEQSRRLGSDGVEDETPPDDDCDVTMQDALGRTSKSNSLPRRFNLQKPTSAANYVGAASSSFFKCQTAPCTPSASLPFPFLHGNHQDVEMRDEEKPPSPVHDGKVSQQGNTQQLFYAPYFQKRHKAFQTPSKCARSPLVVNKSFQRPVYMHSKSLVCRQTFSLKHKKPQTPSADLKLSALSLSQNCEGESRKQEEKAPGRFKLACGTKLKMKWRNRKGVQGSGVRKQDDVKCS